MALYMDEEEIWKCPTHPSKRRRTGICPTCLRDRLSTLCPNCANVRPCTCCPAATTSSSSSSSSSSFSLFSSAASAAGRVSNLIDGEPSMRRSRSVAIPFLRSKSRYTANLDFSDKKSPVSAVAAGEGGAAEFSDQKPPIPSKSGKSSFLSAIFKTSKGKKGEEEKENEESTKTSNDFARMMNRSRSVSVARLFSSGSGDMKSSAKGRGWNFPSPMKAFRQPKTSKILEEQSTMCKVET